MSWNTYLATGGYQGGSISQVLLATGGYHFTVPPSLIGSLIDDDFYDKISYQYKAYNGIAGNIYPDDFIYFDLFFGIATKILVLVTEDVFIQLTYDGVTPQTERRIERGRYLFDAARGFRIRNATPGLAANYQVIPFR